MHPALCKLIALTFKAALRRTFRGARTIKGAFLILFTVVLVGLMVVPSVLTATALRGRAGMPQFSGIVEPYLPLIILAFTVLLIFGPAGETAISFTPAEV